MGNTTRAIFTAGLFSLMVQPINSQGLERFVGQQQQLKQAPLDRPSFYTLRDKLQQFESYEPKNGTEALAHRREMYLAVEEDINRLLLGYGIDLKADEPFFSGIAFGTRYGFAINVVNAASFDAKMIFRNDMSVAIEYTDTKNIPSMPSYFVRLSPNKLKPRPISEVLVNDSQIDKGMHYFERDDFDAAYRFIRELKQEQNRVGSKDYLKRDFLHNQEVEVRNDLLAIHHVPQEKNDDNAYGSVFSEMRASDGRILVPVRFNNLRNATMELVIWPDRDAVLYITKNGKPDFENIYQVMKSNR